MGVRALSCLIGATSELCSWNSKDTTTSPTCNTPHRESQPNAVVSMPSRVQPQDLPLPALCSRSPDRRAEHVEHLGASMLVTYRVNIPVKEKRLILNRGACELHQGHQRPKLSIGSSVIYRFRPAWFAGMAIGFDGRGEASAQIIWEFQIKRLDLRRKRLSDSTWESLSKPPILPRWPD